MTIEAKKRYCPCGRELKPKQKAYCCLEHKARYLKQKPTTCFGVPITEKKRPGKIGPGFRAFIE